MKNIVCALAFSLLCLISQTSAATVCPPGYACRTDKQELQQMCERKIETLYSDLSNPLKEYEFYPEVDCGDTWWSWAEQSTGKGVCRGRVRVRTKLATTGLAAYIGTALAVYNINPKTFYPLAKKCGVALDVIDDWVPILKPISWGIAGMGSVSFILDRVPAACDYLPAFMCTKAAASSIDMFYPCLAAEPKKTWLSQWF